MAGVMAHTMVVRNPDTMEAVALLKGEKLPDWAADLVDEGNLESATAAKSDDSGSGSTEGYAGLKVDELKAEIEKRNGDGREDDAKLSSTGNKGDLVAALEADDAASV